MTDIFDVIADATRRDILMLLLRRSSEEESGTSVSQIVSALAISQPTVSKHLKVLRESDLVSVREEGQRRFYTIVIDPLEEVDDWLALFFADTYENEVVAVNPELPEGAAIAAEVVGRAAASTKHAITAALKRFGV